ncbi:hypothetical protein Pan14r_00200 [Crateriforma conspicua]|uniref:Uncharacterized protein n=1 Tax=Crateriforma conspicua TaxID=2527996 RepID=A0A5C5XZR0_9PLAN|nr:hypothetical protein Pan14r_00200 [Crateriforma conspicua]
MVSSCDCIQPQLVFCSLPNGSNLVGLRINIDALGESEPAPSAIVAVIEFRFAHQESKSLELRFRYIEQLAPYVIGDKQGYYRSFPHSSSIQNEGGDLCVERISNSLLHLYSAGV